MSYLGETYLSDLAGTPYEGFGPVEWAMEYIGRYGQIDGDHHQKWVCDQVARILKGTPIIVSIARWTDHESEYRLNTGDPSPAYLEWVEEMRGERDAHGQREYDYDEGVAP